MNTSLDQLRYLNKSEPLEHKLTFNELQARPVGFQTAIPVDSTLEKMNSLGFKAMEGAMFEAANMASGSNKVGEADGGDDRSSGGAE